jgi:Heparinase II/III-like protein/Heparinase II/III N-terminus
LLDRTTLLARLGASSLDEAWATVVARAPFRDGLPGLSPDRARVLAGAAAAVARRVDLLGSGPVELPTPIDWSRDFVSGRSWTSGYAPRFAFVDGAGGDVKIPWELSRLQWLLPAGQAFQLTGDERYAAAVREVIVEWDEANPYAWTVNWSVAMEVALRAVALSWLVGALGESAAWRDDGFRERLLRLLWLHGDYVSRHLEWSEVRGNHFTADAAGLAFAGLLLGEARWANTGWRLLTEELPRQVYPDGVDFEASSAYHRLVCELFLLPALYREQLGLAVPSSYRDRLAAMARFTAAITGPDGLVPLLGDADDARALPLDGSPVNDHRYLLGLVGITTDEPGSAVFPDGGVYVLACGDDHVVIDCGPVGLAGRGGHGHNDCLSFEATLDGTKLVTDSGTYAYTGAPEWRNRFRGTAAHNTPLVDGEEQNRIPESLWNLADDARPEPMVVEELRFRGAHTGYLRLADPVRPVRTIALEPELHLLLVHDTFDALGPHEIEIPFHIMDGVDVGTPEDGVVPLGAFVLRWRSPEPWNCTVEPAWLSPSYGVKHETLRVVFRRSGAVAALTVLLAPAHTDDERLWAWADRKTS